MYLRIVAATAALVCAAGANQGDIESNARSHPHPHPPPPRDATASSTAKLRCTTPMMGYSMSPLPSAATCWLLLPPPAGSLKTWERKDIPASPSHPGDICCGIPPSQASLKPHLAPPE